MIKRSKEMALKNMSEIFNSMSNGNSGYAKRVLNITEVNLRRKLNTASPRERAFISKVLTTLKETRKLT